MMSIHAACIYFSRGLEIFSTVFEIYRGKAKVPLFKIFDLSFIRILSFEIKFKRVAETMAEK